MVVYPKKPGSFGKLMLKKRSKEICEKISKSNKGKKLSKETRLNISKSKSGKNHFFYGKKLSESHIAKLVEKATGRKHSKKTRKKMCETRGNKVLHIPTGNVYRSLRYACEILNLKYNTELSRIHRDNSKKQFKYI